MGVGVALALGAAVVHALWNLAVAARPPSLAGSAALAGIGALALLPTLAAGLRMDRTTVGLAVVSAALETAYFVLLTSAYRRASAALVYPVARGTAPVITLVVAGLLGTADVTPVQAAGVAVTAIGILLVRGLRVERDAAARRALGLALATATMIASYTLVDARAIDRHDAPPGAYLALVLGIGAVMLATLDAVRLGPGGTLDRVAGSIGRTSVLAGIGIAVAYLLVLLALQYLSAPLVAALRETSVVVATVLAATVLHEHVPRIRLAGACVVALGVALMVI